MKEVSVYIDEHKELLCRENPERSDSWLAKKDMQNFSNWFKCDIPDVTLPAFECRVE